VVDPEPLAVTIGPPGCSVLSAAGILATVAPDAPVMPVRHAAPVRAAAASTVANARFVRKPAPLLMFAQVKTTFNLFSRLRQEIIRTKII
jgi:hypothetical protein